MYVARAPRYRDVSASRYRGHGYGAISVATSDQTAERFRAVAESVPTVAAAAATKNGSIWGASVAAGVACQENTGTSRKSMNQYYPPPAKHITNETTI